MRSRISELEEAAKSLQEKILLYKKAVTFFYKEARAVTFWEIEREQIEILTRRARISGIGGDRAVVGKVF